MSDADRFSELWTDYLEGELDEGGAGELRELMAGNQELVTLAADLLQTHRLLGLIAAEDAASREAFVRSTMDRLPETGDEFVGGVMAHIGQTTHPRSRPRKRWVLAVAVAVLVLGVVSVPLWQRGRTEIASNDPTPSGETAEQGEVRLASAAHATFFGELSPPVGSALEPERQYVLTSGLVEVAFPTGASAIVEAPAVFRVLSGESLALDVGRCSVHAPDGAEGFRVETPATRVVDRGTRFAVSVTETSETEVQVIEGAADIYKCEGTPDREAQVRLTDGQARRFAPSAANSVVGIPFDADTYRRGLPDRVVSYKATTAKDGGAEELISVSVQRGGRVAELPVEDLIPARVAWFKATAPGAFLCGGDTLPTPRIDTSSDRSLITGVINPGGSREPLTSDPVMEGEAGTPGLAIRFTKPVSNGPGPDVVFFDLQTFTNPPQGDAFHVSPLRFREGLKSHTIRGFDLTLESPEARELTDFYVHMFARPAGSPDELESLPCTPQAQKLKFRALAVGIDLSDLGYAPGESVQGLFFQDALDDNHYVDPVFIAGLPSTK